jgi:hypothetical protein
MLKQQPLKFPMRHPGNPLAGPSLTGDDDVLLNVALQRGNSAQSFVERSADIERGTVTVRSGC